MTNKLKYLILFCFVNVTVWSQTPQNVTQLDDENKESLWTSTSAIIFVAALILLLIVGRTWSKKIHEKRDELTDKDKEK